MPSLADIPFLSGYTQQNAINQQQGAQQLQQVGLLAQLQQRMQAQQEKQKAADMEARFRAGLRPDMTPEQRLAHAAQFMGPEALGRMDQGHLDREATREATKESKAASLRLAEQSATDRRERNEREIDFKYDSLAQKTANDEDRRRLEANRAADKAENDRRHDATLRMIAASRPQPPIQTTDNAGNVKLYDRAGNLIKDLGNVGKPSGAFEKTQASKRQLSMDLTRAITELEAATKDGGLIDKSTGSGAGALVDSAAGFFGKATPGAIAVGEMKPIYDLVLKMVPRFEGPQSDKDTVSYEKAAGQLANPVVPNSQKKAAGREILRLMKLRKGQFSSKDAEVGGAPAEGWKDL